MLPMLPIPPTDLADRALPIEVVPAGTILQRIHQTSHGPIWFGPEAGQPPVNRFDDPRGEYAVCYLAASRIGAFVETLLRDRPSRVVSAANLAHLAVSALTLLRDVPVVKAYDEGLVRLGTTVAVSGARLEFPGATPGQSYAHAMAWSRALHDHLDAPHGIAYRSSHDDSVRCIAIFGDRAGDALAVGGPPRVLSRQQALLAKVVCRYGIILLPAIPAP